MVLSSHSSCSAASSSSGDSQNSQPRYPIQIGPASSPATAMSDRRIAPGSAGKAGVASLRVLNRTKPGSPASHRRAINTAGNNAMPHIAASNSAAVSEPAGVNQAPANTAANGHACPQNQATAMATAPMTNAPDIPR